MQQLNELLTVLLETAKQTKSLAVSELPLVATDLLKWEIIQGYVVGILLIGVPVLLAVLMYKVVERAVRLYKDDEYRMAYIVSLALILPIVFGIQSILSAVKAQVTPRAALIDIIQDKLRK